MILGMLPSRQMKPLISILLAMTSNLAFELANQFYNKQIGVLKKTHQFLMPYASVMLL